MFYVYQNKVVHVTKNVQRALKKVFIYLRRKKRNGKKKRTKIQRKQVKNSKKEMMRKPKTKNQAEKGKPKKPTKKGKRSKSTPNHKKLAQKKKDCATCAYMKTACWAGPFAGSLKARRGSDK